MNALFAFTQAAIGSMPKAVLAGVVVSAALGASVQPANALSSNLDAIGQTDAFADFSTGVGDLFSVDFLTSSVVYQDQTGLFAPAGAFSGSTGNFEILFSGGFIGTARLTSDLTFNLAGAPTITFASGTVFGFSKSSPNAVFLSTESGTVGAPATSGTAALSFQQIGGARSFNLTADAQPVPGPLPVLGAAAAFGYSRKLRSRISQSKQQSNLA